MNKNLTIFAVDDERIVLELYQNIFDKEQKSNLDFFKALDDKEDADCADLRTLRAAKNI